MSSASEAVVSGMETLSTIESNQRRERRFFTGMAVMLALACFACFAPSYSLKSQFGNAPIQPLVHLHGAVFSAWMFLLIVQTSLIATGRSALHRKLGIAGAVLAVLLLVTGAFVIWGRATTLTPALPHDFILRFL